MSTQQHSISSGFDKDTTAEQVLEGTDLTGKLFVVTGGYSGVGLATTQALCAAGATVLVPARRPERAREVLAGLARVEVASLDLGDLASVRSFADAFLASGRPVHALINNAAVMANPETRVGPGWESQFATNHLGHYALTNLLWPALTAAGRTGGARVVSLSSIGHTFGAMNWDDLQWTSGYEKWRAYGQAKTANVLFAVHLDAIGAPAGVRAFAVHPGGIRTPLQRHLADEEFVAMGWVDEQGNDLYPWKTPEQGAATSVWAATSPQLDGLGGVYCEDVDVAEVRDPDAGGHGGVGPHAIDPEEAARLWAVSAELTGIDAVAASA